MQCSWHQPIYSFHSDSNPSVQSQHSSLLNGLPGVGPTPKQGATPMLQSFINSFYNQRITMSTINLDKSPTSKIKCIAFSDEHLAFIAATSKGSNELVIYKSSKNPVPIKAIDLGEDNPIEVKIITLAGRQLISVVLDNSLKIYNLDGSLFGVHSEPKDLQQCEDWFVAAQVFQKSIVLANRLGKLTWTEPATLSFKNLVDIKRPISCLCSIGKWLVVGDESGKIGRISSFWQGCNKQLNLCPQKLPIYLMQRFNQSELIIGTCSGELLFLDVYNFSVSMRIQAHAGMLTGLACYKDIVSTCSDDGYANRLRVVDGAVVATVAFKFARVMTGVVFVEAKPCVGCYEISHLTELPL